MNKRVGSIIFAICLLFSFVFVLSSCNFGAAVGIVGAEINESGELVLVYSDGNEQN